MKEVLEKCFWCDFIAIWAGFNGIYMIGKKPNDIVTENKKDSCVRYACDMHKDFLFQWMQEGNPKRIKVSAVR